LLDGKSVFIKGALPDEVVLVDVVEDKKNYLIAETKKVLEQCSARVIPFCNFFNNCGGCHYQYIAYDKQIEIKEAILLDCLNRIAHLDFELSEPIFGTPIRYRIKAIFKKNNDKIGFYRAKTRDIVDIDDCLIVKEEIIDGKKFAKEITKEITEAEIEIVSFLDTIISIKSNSGVVKSYLLDNKKETYKPSSLKNNKYIELQLLNLQYMVSPFSFFQTNWKLNNIVVKQIIETLDFRGKDLIDLYAGSGNFCLPLSKYVKSVIAYEEDKNAFRSALINAKINKIDNCRFVHSRVEDIKIDKRPDVLIINPPRTGITNRAMENIIKLKAKEVIYMSCDPSTFARDIGKLKKFYHIESIRLIDFFPQTFHIESLATMKAL